MTCFRLIAVYRDVHYSLLGALAEDDGEPYFYTSDVARMLGNVRGRTARGGYWQHSYPLRGNLSGQPYTMWMIRIDHLIRRLQRVQTPRARALIYLLQYGVVRDLPYQGSIPRVIQATDFHGITFQSWLLEFKQNYGPRR